MLLYYPQSWQGSWSTTDFHSHSHIQITNLSKSHTQKCTAGPDYFLSSSLSCLSRSFSRSLTNGSLSPCLSTSPSLTLIMSLSPSSQAELILWILTLIQWNSYNPLSDYRAPPPTHTHKRMHRHAQHAYNTDMHHLSQIQQVNTWYTSLHDWCPCKSSAKTEGGVG